MPNIFSAIFAKAYLATTAALLALLIVAVLVARGERALADKRLEAALAWRDTALQWRARSGQWEKAFKSAEKMRKDDQAAANRSANEAEASCKKRVNAARRSALAIRDVVTVEPNYDARGCPTEQLAPSDRLSDALRPRSAPE